MPRDLAAKAPGKLSGPHLHASLKQLERAVARANKQAETAQHSQPNVTSDATASSGPVENESSERDAVDEDVEEVQSVDADEPDAPLVDA
jgi:hypothetical protein